MKLTFHPAKGVQSSEQLVAEAVAAGHPRKAAEDAAAYATSGQLYLDATQTYQVDVRRTAHAFGDETELWHLSIKRVDREPIHDWRIMQAIKNALLGDECEAVELYPAESRLVDTSNQYHLFGFKVSYPKRGFPFGFTERSVVDDPGMPRAKQRPRS